jgi:hypothetical protein
MRVLRIAVTLALLAIVGVLIYRTADASAVAKTFDALTLKTVAYVSLFLFVGALAASLRLKIIARSMGYPLTFREAVGALSVGAIGGNLFFQIAGQLMARGALLARRNVPVAATVVLTGYERLAALLVSTGLAAAGALHIFGRLRLDLAAGGLSILNILLGLCFATAFAAMLGWGREVLRFAPALRGNLGAAAASMLISLVVQILTIAAYTTAAHSLAPDVPIQDLLAAATIVMLAASVPISLGGWGMREFSAVLALGAVGMGANASFAVAVLIGIAGLAVVVVLAAASVPGWRGKNQVVSTPNSPAVDYSAALDWLLPLAAVTLVFFQLYVPTRSGQVNVNLADPIAILGGALFLISHCSRRRWPEWRLTALNAHFLAMTFVVLTAFLIGLARVGYTDWQGTKAVGWLILLAYGATAALLVERAGERGLRLLLLTFIGSAVGVIAFWLIPIVGAETGLITSQAAVQLEGFSQNRNAFGFVLLLALAAVGFVQGRAQVFVTAMLLAGIWFTGSNAAGGTAVVLIGAAYFLRVISLRTLARALVIAAAIAVIPSAGAVGAALVVEGLQQAGSSIRSLLAEAAQQPGAIVRDALALNTSSNAERFASIRGGIDLFLSYPLFGAGLGHFMELQVQAQHPLVIHSTPVWLLAEFGAVGFAVFAASLFRVARTELGMLRVKTATNDPAAAFILLVLLAFVIISTVHEMMYQRAFWLLLGGVLALRIKPGAASARPDVTSPAA